jgi:hypothetical protein
VLGILERSLSPISDHSATIDAMSGMGGLQMPDICCVNRPSWTFCLRKHPIPDIASMVAEWLPIGLKSYKGVRIRFGEKGI